MKKINLSLLTKPKLTTVAFSIGVLFNTSAMAGLDDVKTILDVLLKKGVISQKDHDDTLNELSSKPLDSVPPVQFVQDALGVQAKEVQKAVEYTKKDEKNGSVQPNGFGWVSADGESSIKLTGVVQFDARNIENGLTSSQDKDSASGADNFEVRRARLGVNGTFWKNVDFEVLTNLVGSSPNLIHRAYVNYSYNKSAQIRIGRFKQPFSLEELTTAQGIDFMERSYGNQMVASNRNGVMLHGAPIKGMTYAVSAYQDGFNELSNTNQVGTLGAARITSNLAELGGISDTVIHFGAAVDMGKYEVIPTTSTDSGSAASTVTRATVLSFRTENRGLTNAYRAQIAGDTVTAGYGVQGNDAADISKNLKGIELALATGPFKFQTEYFDSRYSASSLNYCIADSTTIDEACTKGSYGTSSYDLRAKAAYYELVYNLTGESWANSYKSGAFTTIKPKANFSLGQGGGWGAWQLALRYSNYSVDEPSSFTRSASSTTGVSTGKSKINNQNGWTNRVENAESANTWTLGLNWILNPNARIMLNYADTHFGRPVYYLTTSVPSSLGSTSREQVISVRTQLNF